MRVLFDHQAFTQTYGGVSRSFVELLKHVKLKVEVVVSLKYSKNLYINELLPSISYPFKSIHFPYKRRIIKKLNFNNSILNLKRGEYDIFHATFDDSYFLSFVKSPFVITIHDLIPELRPEFWPVEWLDSRQEIINTASHIITVSNNTKQDLLQFYPALKQKNNVSVIYHGYTFNEKSINTLAPSLPDKYILYVGGRSLYKNFNRFIISISKLLRERPNLYLVCTGSSFSQEEFQLIESLGIQTKILALQISETDMNFVYKNALLFAFPSLYEGFGLPILEAWGNGCPVFLSNKSSFPEIAGDGAMYFNPKDTQNIYDVILDGIDNNELRMGLILKGFERLKNFKWEDAAEQLICIYENVIRNSKES